jgi:hypothetical protein
MVCDANTKFHKKSFRLRIVMLSVNLLSAIMGSVVYAECH